MEEKEQKHTQTHNIWHTRQLWTGNLFPSNKQPYEELCFSLIFHAKINGYFLNNDGNKSKFPLPTENLLKGKFQQKLEGF